MLNTHRLSLVEQPVFGSSAVLKLLEKINHSLKGALAAAIALTSLSVMAQEDKLKDGLYAEIDTTKGTIVAQLEFEKTPLTTAIAGLAEGTRHYSKTGGKPVDQKGKYYNGIPFHRVIKDFRDSDLPAGNRPRRPRLPLPDEFDKSLRHTGAGILSMANSGPGTNEPVFIPTKPPRGSTTATPCSAKSSRAAKSLMQSPAQLLSRPTRRGREHQDHQNQARGRKAKAFKSDEAQFAKLRASIKSPAEKNKAEAASSQSQKRGRRKNNRIRPRIQGVDRVPAPIRRPPIRSQSTIPAS